MNIQTQETEIDSLLKTLEIFNLPSKQLDRLNDSVFKLNFDSKFDSICLTKVIDNNLIRFQEAYDFEDFIGEFDTIMEELAEYGSINAKKYLDFDSRVSKNPDKVIEVPFFGGSHIGNFAIYDTSKIIQLVNKNNIPEKLPSDLEFVWSESSKDDSICLYLIKSKSVEQGLDETNIIQMSTAKEERENPIQFDKNGIPTKWSSETFYTLSITFDKKGADKIYELTERNSGKYIAFKLNGSIYSAARVMFPIEGGRVTISLSDVNELKRFYKSIFFNHNNGLIKVSKFEIIEKSKTTKAHVQ